MIEEIEFDGAHAQNGNKKGFAYPSPRAAGVARKKIDLQAVKRGAVRLTSRWLWTYLIANMAHFVFWVVVAKLHQSLILVQMGWYHVVGPITTFALWCFYLEHSKRVRETYLLG